MVSQPALFLLGNGDTLGDVSTDHIVGICMAHPDMQRPLERLPAHDLVPDADVQVVRREPFEGPLHIRVGHADAHYVIGRDIAERIAVTE